MRRARANGVKKPPRSAPSKKSGPEDLPGARRAELPQAPSPQLATLVALPPEGEGWIHEIKYDGYRLFLRIERGRVKVSTRKGNDWTDRFPTLARAAARLPVEDALIDGEVVKLDARGVSDFQSLQNSIGAASERDLHYYAFDLLHLDGYDITQAALRDRKRLLAELLAGTADPIRYSDHVEGPGKPFLEEARRHGLEGIVSKRADRPYRPGRRGEWLKIKCGLEQEFVIAGWTDPEGARSGFGALLLGVHEEGKFRYAGKVGTGFSERTLEELLRKLGPLEIHESPFPALRRGRKPRGVHWVRPKLVGQVAFMAWTNDGLVRHASFKGLREDKPPEAVGREEPSGPAMKDRSPGAAAPRAGARNTGKEPIEVDGVRVTNPGRVVYPETGATKEDVARYFLLAAERMLPHIEDRPLTLFRCPDGRVKGCFFQKHANQTVPPAVRRIPIHEEGEKKKADYLMVDSLEGLISVIQMGALELHTWGSRTRKLELPDRIIFDLDPDPAVPWERMVDAAFLVKERLETLGLESFLKTTGGKGLHIVAPLSPRKGWDDVKTFARALARSIAAGDPDTYLDTASKSARRGRIYVDWLRNGRGATAIEAYSTRAREGAPIAMPIHWEELRQGVRSSTFNLDNAPARLKEKDPWKGYSKVRQSITRAALAKLARELR